MRTNLFFAAATALAALAAPIAQAAPAVVINPAGGCALYDGNGGIAFTTDTKITATQSSNRNSTVTCKTTVAPPAGGGAAQYDYASSGNLCVITTPTGAELTDQWHETVSASGQATMICQVTGKP